MHCDTDDTIRPAAVLRHYSPRMAVLPSCSRLLELADTAEVLSSVRHHGAVTRPVAQQLGRELAQAAHRQLRHWNGQARVFILIHWKKIIIIIDK